MSKGLCPGQTLQFTTIVNSEITVGNNYVFIPVDFIFTSTDPHSLSHQH